MFMLIGKTGFRTIIAPTSVQAVEEIPITKESKGGVRVYLSGGHEIDIWGVGMSQFWDEIREHMGQE